MPDTSRPAFPRVIIREWDCGHTISMPGQRIGADSPILESVEGNCPMCSKDTEDTESLKQEEA